MNTQPLAALGGLALGGLLLGGMMWWQSGLEPARSDDWRPPCVARMGKAWSAVGGPKYSRPVYISLQAGPCTGM